MASLACALVRAFIYFCCSRRILCLRSDFQAGGVDNARPPEEGAASVAPDASLVVEQGGSMNAPPVGIFGWLAYASPGKPVQGARSDDLSVLDFSQVAGRGAVAPEVAFAGAHRSASGQHGFPILWVCVGPIAAVAVMALVMVCLRQRSGSPQRGADVKAKAMAPRCPARQGPAGEQGPGAVGSQPSRRDCTGMTSTVVCDRSYTGRVGGMEDEYPALTSDFAVSRPESQRSMARTSALASSSDMQLGWPSGVEASLPTRGYSAVTANPLGDVPLCPLLVVPESTRLACVLQNDVCRRKQELTFNVRGLSSGGGAPLFQIRVSDSEASTPGIFAESLDSKDQLAFLSTEELWQGAASPVFRIARPSGATFGTMQKTASGDYLVFRGGVELLRFTGDFLGHNIEVVDPSGRAAGRTWQTSPEEYQVHVYSLFDAGLVIIGLVAIDKCEIGSGTWTPTGY